MEYRIANKEDLHTILNMKNQVKKRIESESLLIWLNGYPDDELIMEDIEKGYGRVVVEEDNIVAYASLYPSIEDYPKDTFFKANVLSFGRIMVCDAYLGKHCASFFVKKMITEGKERGFSGMGILVDSCNLRALRLYERYGFKKEGSRHFPYAYLDIYSLYY